MSREARPSATDFPPVEHRPRFVGTIKTLALGTIKAKIVSAERTSDKAPDYWVFAGAIEFGAGWKKKSEHGRDYARSSTTTRASRTRSTRFDSSR